MAKTCLGSALVALCCTLTSSSLALYSVRVCEIDSPDKLAQVRASLGTMAQESWIHDNGETGNYIVLAGGYCSHIEAKIATRYVERAGFLSPEIVIVSGDLITTSATSWHAATATSLFQLPLQDSEAAIPKNEYIVHEKQYVSDSALSCRAAGIGPSSYTIEGKEVETLRELENAYFRAPEDAKAFVRFEIGRLRKKVGKDPAEVEEAYLPVATGVVPAPRRLQERAAEAVARSWRYGKIDGKQPQKLRVDAYEGFRELALHAVDSAIRARCAMECVAMTLEYVKGKDGGEWSDVQAEAARMLQIIPPSESARRATIELMCCEAFYYAGDYNRAITAADGVIDQYGKYEREVGMALIVKGLAYYMMGDRAKAREIFEFGASRPSAPSGAAIFKHETTDFVYDSRAMCGQWIERLGL